MYTTIPTPYDSPSSPSDCAARPARADSSAASSCTDAASPLGVSHAKLWFEGGGRGGEDDGHVHLGVARDTTFTVVSFPVALPPAAAAAAAAAGEGDEDRRAERLRHRQPRIRRKSRLGLFIKDVVRRTFDQCVLHFLLLVSRRCRRVVTIGR